MPLLTEAETVLMDNAKVPLVEVMALADFGKVAVGVKVDHVLDGDTGALEASDAKMDTRATD